MLSRRVPPTGGSNEWSRALAARRARGPVLDLVATDPTRLGLSPLAEAAECLAASAGAAHRPDGRGMDSARAAVAATLAPGGPHVGVEEIVLTSSTSEAYAHLFRLLGDPGAVFLAPVPSYPLFEPLADAEGVTLRPYRLEFDGRWHLDRDSFERAATGAKAAILVQPNNPTGSMLDADDLAFVERTSEREGLALICDEVFGHFALPPRTHRLPSLLDSVRRVPTFVLGGLSKLCGLPHLKLAWIVAAGPAGPRREALAGLDWLGDLFLSVATPVQAALPGLLELRHAFGDRVRARIAHNLAALDAICAARPGLSRLPLEAGWMAMLRVPATRSDEAWALALIDRGVALHPGHFYDTASGEYLVASLIADPADFRAGLDALSALMSEKERPVRSLSPR